MNHFYRTKSLLVLILLGTACSGPDGIQLVRNGRTAYSIYLDPSAPESVTIAAADLKNYFEKVTGASPEIITSTEIPTVPYISLGNTEAARTAGLDASDIPIDGYRMVTRDKNLFILGPDTPDGEVNSKGGINRGTSNGVYTFIEDYLGVRWLMPGELGEEYTEIRDISLPVLNRTESSPFDYREIASRAGGPLEEEWDRRMKLGEVAAVEFNHSWIKTVPASLYDEHPEWFAMENGKRIPPIGNYKLETTNPQLVQYFADQIIEIFRKNPDRKWYSLSPSDGGGFSDSPESMALVERDEFGNLSRTPLILTFYNDVARIVGKEFPDHMLGGLLYGNKGGYRCPPSGGLEIEPNLALMIPNGPAYGFRLYRDFAQDNWADSIYIPEWSELSKKYGFDTYYNDYLITLIPSNGIITSPAPFLLNFTFSRLDRYGFNGANIAGNPAWPVTGPGNYTMAKLFWDPQQDAFQIQADYYRAAYGAGAGESIRKLYELIDKAFSEYYARDHNIAWNLVEEHLEFIYAPNYPEMEQYYLEALSLSKKPKQQQRLELFGQVLSLLQWNLRDYGYLPSSYSSPLTLSDEQIDSLVAEQNDAQRITTNIGYHPPELKVEIMPALADAGKGEVPPVPVATSATMVMQALQSGEITVSAVSFNRRAEFIQYILTDDQGSELQKGAIAEGRTIQFTGKAGQSYFLRTACRKAYGSLQVKGAAIAYNTTGKRGLQLQGSLMENSLDLYFYVPKGIKSFNVILGKSGEGTTADIISPDGRNAGRLNTLQSSTSQVDISGNEDREGFWKIELEKNDGRAFIRLDEQLPQWITPDPAHPVRILPL